MADVAVRDLTVEYASGGYIVRPLDKFSLEADTGSLVVLLGPSGCGKSTLLSALAGILKPASGEILVNGTSVTALSGTALTEYRRRTVGVVFQAFNLVPSLTATENVAAPLLAAGESPAAARRRANELLDQVGLSERASHRPDHLSGGQQQRVAIARALALDPPLIIADEPTAHLDYVQVEGVLRLVRELAAPGRLVVVATHDDRLLPLADQVVEMVPRFVENLEGGPRHMVFDDGDVIFEEGSRGGLIYVVEEGTVAVTRTSADRREDVLAVFGAGDHFGEMGPLFGLPRSATARAQGGTAVVTGYTAAQFRDLVGEDRLGGLLGRAGARLSARSQPAPSATSARAKKPAGRRQRPAPAKDASTRPAASKRSSSKVGATAKKTPPKKAPVTKAPTKKSSANKAPVKKAPVKKSSARKAPAKAGVQRARPVERPGARRRPG